MRTLGIDLGSREVKIAVMEQGTVIHNEKLSTMSFYRNCCRYDEGLYVDMEKLGIGPVDRAVSTGYGRNNTDLKLFTPINEIKAHVYGAIHQTGMRDFVLLDVGGQDVKVVRVEKGMVTDLELNEKCAASCGRFMENMANVLEVPLDELFRHHEDPVAINTTCAVFSESELIGRIAEGSSMERLCAGVNHAMYKRLRPMLAKFRGRQLVLTGGSARNLALKRYLCNDYDEVVVPDEPQYNGAIGCCFYGERKIRR